ELEHFEFLAPKCMDHSDRAETFLRLGEDRAFLFLDRCRFATDPLRKQIDCANNQWNDGKRNHGELPIQPKHDEEGSDQRDRRRKNIREAFVVDRLDGLRIVSDTKAGIARTARIMEFE